MKFDIGFYPPAILKFINYILSALGFSLLKKPVVVDAIQPSYRSTRQFVSLETPSFSYLHGLKLMCGKSTCYDVEHSVQMVIGKRLESYGFVCLAREFLIPHEPYVMDLLFQMAGKLYLVEAKHKNSKFVREQAVRNAQIVADYLGASVTPVSYCYTKDEIIFHSTCLTMSKFNLTYLLEPDVDNSIVWSYNYVSVPLTIDYNTKQPIFVCPEAVDASSALKITSKSWLRLSRGEQIQEILDAYSRFLAAEHFATTSNKILFYTLTGDVIDLDHDIEGRAISFGLSSFYHAIYTCKEQFDNKGVEPFHNFNIPTSFRKVRVIRVR